MTKLNRFFSISLIISALLLLISNANALQAGNYIFDQKDSKVEFKIKNLGFMNVSGKFNIFKGNLKLSDNFLNSKIEGIVETSSIDTDSESRDKHLKSEDFFEVAKYPNMKFVGKNLTGEQMNFKVTGDLTIKGITKSVTFSGIKSDDQDKFQISCIINRKEFNIIYGSFISDEVQIILNLQPIKN
ncbi:YceI family protein [Fluviispira sanaruensis]|uniref:YceI family protein n=1 Tax=Fluviispira sanaruensis TaxID=2493639 RepID=A0A4V0P2M7_FLUSA|nr:YceI family protein [Fluviispira sanaruensis]BBH53767.1 YceI family protein [Fluviispira sanaruensis]